MFLGTSVLINFGCNMKDSIPKIIPAGDRPVRWAIKREVNHQKNDYPVKKCPTCLKAFEVFRGDNKKWQCYYYSGLTLLRLKECPGCLGLSTQAELRAYKLSMDNIPDVVDEPDAVEEEVLVPVLVERSGYTHADVDIDANDDLDVDDLIDDD